MSERFDPTYIPAEPQPLTRTGTYRAGAAVGLVLVAGVLIERSAGAVLPLVVLVPAVVGLWYRSFFWPAAFLVLLTWVAISPTGSVLISPLEMPLDRAYLRMLDLMLAAGVVGYLACQSRLHFLPPDTPPAANEATPASTVPIEELTRLVLVILLAVVAAQLIWMLVTAYNISAIVEDNRLVPTLERAGAKGNGRITRLLVALGLTGVIFGAVGFWAWYQGLIVQSVEQSRLFLLDTAWRESRRELSRQELWRAWRLTPRTGPILRWRFLVRAIIGAALVGSILYGVLNWLTQF